MMLPTALTICALDTGFSLFLFGSDDDADKVMMKLKAVPGFVTRFQLGAPSHDITVATTAVARKASCALIWLPALSECAESIIWHIFESMHQRANTSAVLLSGATYLPSDLVGVVDVVLTGCEDHSALIQRMVNGVTRYRYRIDIHHLNDILIGPRQEWCAAVAVADGPSRALDEIISALKVLGINEQNKTEFSRFYLVISGHILRFSEKRDIIRKLFNSTAANCSYLVSQFEDKSLGKYIGITLFCAMRSSVQQSENWLAASWSQTKKYL